MTPEHPARMPDMMTAILNRLAYAMASGTDKTSNQPRDLVHQLVDQLLDVGSTLAVLTGPAHAPIRSAARASLREAARVAKAGATSTGPAAGFPLGQAGAADATAAGVSSPAGRIGVLPLGPSKAGEMAEGELVVHNDTRDTVGGLRLTCAALVSEAGARIGGATLSVLPDPLDLPPRSSRVVDVRINVPAGVAPATYVGLLSAVDSPSIRTLILVEIVP